MTVPNKTFVFNYTVIENLCNMKQTERRVFLNMPSTNMSPVSVKTFARPCI